jgi:hypothetical protein
MNVTHIHARISKALHAFPGSLPSRDYSVGAAGSSAFARYSDDYAEAR